MKSKYIWTVLFAAGASLAYADNPAPINSAYIGVNRTIQVNGQVGYQTQGGGGEFYGTLSAPNMLSVPTFFWCVDDQEAFYFSESRTANVSLLSTIGANSSQVRYGAVTNSSSPQWTNTDGLPAAAADRYKLAAYLVTQYTGFNPPHPTIDGSSSDIRNRNDAIQQAIWSITNTSSPVGGAIYETGYHNVNGTTGSDPIADSVSHWINQAESHYTDVNAANWAVVSWGAQPDGTLNYGRYDAAASGNQTFLVELDGITTNSQVTPEPGFYGALAVGLCGLIFAVRRRKLARN